MRLSCLFIYSGFNLAYKFSAHRFELKIHSALERLHISSADERAVIPEDRPTQHMQRGMGAHQLIAPRPVQRPACSGAGGRQRLLSTQKMQDVIALLLHLLHRINHTCNCQESQVTGLASPTWIKGSAIQN